MQTSILQFTLYQVVLLKKTKTVDPGTILGQVKLKIVFTAFSAWSSAINKQCKAFTVSVWYLDPKTKKFFVCFLHNQEKLINKDAAVNIIHVFVTGPAIWCLIEPTKNSSIFPTMDFRSDHDV